MFGEFVDRIFFFDKNILREYAREKNEKPVQRAVKKILSDYVQIKIFPAIFSKNCKNITL